MNLLQYNCYKEIKNHLYYRYRDYKFRVEKLLEPKKCSWSLEGMNVSHINETTFKEMDFISETKRWKQSIILFWWNPFAWDNKNHRKLILSWVKTLNNFILSSSQKLKEKEINLFSPIYHSESENYHSTWLLVENPNYFNEQSLSFFVENLFPLYKNIDKRQIFIWNSFWGTFIKMVENAWYQYMKSLCIEDEEIRSFFNYFHQLTLGWVWNNFWKDDWKPRFPWFHIISRQDKRIKKRFPNLSLIERKKLEWYETLEYSKIQEQTLIFCDISGQYPQSNNITNSWRLWITDDNYHILASYLQPTTPKYRTSPYQLDLWDKERIEIINKIMNNML